MPEKPFSEPTASQSSGVSGTVPTGVEQALGSRGATDSLLPGEPGAVIQQSPASTSKLDAKILRQAAALSKLQRKYNSVKGDLRKRQGRVRELAAMLEKLTDYCAWVAEGGMPLEMWDAVREADEVLGTTHQERAQARDSQQGLSASQ